MPDTTVATGSFSSRRAADQAVQRLVTSGFARNSIELQRHPDDDGYDVMVHTRQDNLHRVQHLIEASPSAYAVRQTASNALRSVKAHPFLILGAGIVAGVGLYTLFSQNGRSSGRSRRGSGRYGYRAGNES